MVTISDVAKKANVSIATVSRVMNNQGGYSEKTRKHVLQVVEECGYEPNAVARSLINKKTNSIGILFPNISSVLTSELLNGIENVAGLNDSSVIVSYTYSEKERTMKYLKILNEKRIDGLIFTSEVLTEEYYEYIKKMDIPVVLLLTKSADYAVPYVKVDDAEAAYSATEYLISRGHKKIGMLSGSPGDEIAGAPRIQGFKRALQDHGLPNKDNQIYICDGFGYDEGKKNLENLLKRFPGLTALFAASDEMAIGALSAAYELGIRIPEDLSIIGYDNLKISEMSVPGLTTVGQPLYEMGSKAAAILYQLINAEEVAEKFNTMEHRIIERKSVQNLSGEN